MIETSKRDTVKSHEAYYNHGILSWLSKAISGRANRSKYDVTVNGTLKADEFLNNSGVDILFTPSARAYNGSNITVANSSDTFLSLNSEYIDNDAMHDNSTNNGRITFKTAGKYVVGFSVQWAVNSNGVREIAILSSGTGAKNPQAKAVTPGTAIRDTSQFAVGLIDVAVDDYIYPFVWQNSGGNLTIYYVSFWAFKLPG